MDNKAQLEEDPESFKLGLGGREAGGQGRERGAPDVSPWGRGAGSREETLRVVGRAAASGRLLGEDRPGSEGSEGSGGGVRSAKIGRGPDPAPGTVPLLTRWEAADSGRAVPATGLRDQKASPHRGRGGRVDRGRTIPHVSPPPPSPTASSAAETCAEPGPRRHRREGGLVNGCSASSGERSGLIRRGCGGGSSCGCCHSRAGWD